MTTKLTAAEVRERIREAGHTITSAADLMDMSRQNLNKHLAAESISEAFIRLFNEKFPPTTKVSKRSNAVQVELGDKVVMYVPLVPQYAYGGYRRGFADDEFIETLPKAVFLVEREYKGTYRAFEVRGDSMDDGSRDSYVEGDILLCREIKKELWIDSKLHIRKWDFVIVHKTEGIVVKRIIEHNVRAGTLTLHSLNPVYPDETVKISDVHQIFNVLKVERTKK